MSQLYQGSRLHWELAQRYTNWYEEYAGERNKHYNFLSTGGIKEVNCYN